MAKITRVNPLPSPMTHTLNLNNSTPASFTTDFLPAIRFGELQQFPELFDAHARVADNLGIHRIVARDNNVKRAFGHEDVPALAVNVEAGFFQGLHGAKVIDARKFRHVMRRSIPARGFHNAAPARRKVRDNLA